jgi:hypothetical protein
VPGGLGLRFAVEAIFLVAVAAVAVVANFHWPAIILVMALAWVLVSAIEWSVSRRASAARAESVSAEPERPAEVEIPQHVRVLAADQPPAPKRAAPPPAPPVPEPEPEPAPEPEPVPVAVVQVEEPVPVIVPVPVPVPVPEPVVLVAVPEPPPPPPPPPEPVRQVAPEPPVPAVVPLVSRDARPREWNLWELERLTRAGGGHDPSLDEERNYLLMYLREFANADGALPVDFDGLVRDSFGDLIGVA